MFLEFGEGNGTLLQYCCLENPMDGGAWWAAVHGVTRSRTRLSDFTFTFMHWRRKGTPLQCSCLKNPRDGGAWWAAVYGVAQSWTRLKRLSSSSGTEREAGRLSHIWTGRLSGVRCYGHHWPLTERFASCKKPKLLPTAQVLPIFPSPQPLAPTRLLSVSELDYSK